LDGQRLQITAAGAANEDKRRIALVVALAELKPQLDAGITQYSTPQYLNPQ